jgi:hypothetical protein
MSQLVSPLECGSSSPPAVSCRRSRPFLHRRYPGAAPLLLSHRVLSLFARAILWVINSPLFAAPQLPGFEFPLDFDKECISSRRSLLPNLADKGTNYGRNAHGSSSLLNGHASPTADARHGRSASYRARSPRAAAQGGFSPLLQDYRRISTLVAGISKTARATHLIYIPSTYTNGKVAAGW